MGMPVTTTLSAFAPRAMRLAFVSSAATQYKSTACSIQSACASKSVTTQTVSGLNPLLSR